MCESRPNGCLVFLLVFWLLLTIFREAFDLIGRLWVPVVYNLIQILSCISGLFAACQYRLSLLIALSASCLISLAYNVFLILWYNGSLGDRTRPLLSAGLPYSYSFFLRYTPFCESYFNLTTSLWLQRPNCILPYYNVEILQALIHVFMAVLTMILSLVLACSKRVSNNESRTEVRTKTLSIDFSGTGSGSACLMGNLEKIHLPSRHIPSKVSESISSGYLNSSYESPETEIPAARHMNPITPTRNYERKSERKNVRSKQMPKTPSSTAMYQGNISADPDEDPYPPDDFKAEKQERVSVYGESKRSNSRSEQLALSKKEPPNRMDSVEDSLSSDENRSPADDGPSYSKVKQRSGAAKSLKSAAYETFQGRQQNNPKREYIANQKKGPSFIRDEGRLSSSNLTSLISFDPKSGTLIRVKEHATEDDRESVNDEPNVYREVYMCPRRSISQESVPSVDAPVLSQDLRINPEIDSGRPSSSANSGISPSWSQAGISHPKVPPTTTIPSRPMGYDPALCDVLPPRPVHRAAPPPPTNGTAFPVEHQRRNSAHATSLSTTIPLISSRVAARPTALNLGTPEVGQRLMAYSSVPEERERPRTSSFPATNSGLLV